MDRWMDGCIDLLDGCNGLMDGLFDGCTLCLVRLVFFFDHLSIWQMFQFLWLSLTVTFYFRYHAHVWVWYVLDMFYVLVVGLCIYSCFFICRFDRCFISGYGHWLFTCDCMSCQMSMICIWICVSSLILVIGFVFGLCIVSLFDFCSILMLVLVAILFLTFCYLVTLLIVLGTFILCVQSVCIWSTS